MVVLNKNSFKLPRVDPPTWGLLLKLGLEYDRASYTYRVANCNNIEKLLDTLSEILHENVTFTVGCLICSKEFSCQECRYYELCETRNMPFGCVCGRCLEEGKTTPEK